uniref:Uncharacterized protein n=1 Tax=Cannabis sativa TaxID=3483 RepID=A0A803QK22_CANSA
MIGLHVAINSWLARLFNCQWRYELKGAPTFPRKASAACLWNTMTNPCASRDIYVLAVRKRRAIETTSVLWRVEETVAVRSRPIQTFADGKDVEKWVSGSAA